MVPAVKMIDISKELVPVLLVSHEEVRQADKVMVYAELEWKRVLQRILFYLQIFHIEESGKQLAHLQYCVYLKFQ